MVRREIASVRLLTVHLAGVERYRRKSAWVLSEAALSDSFNISVAQVLNSPDRGGEVDVA